MADSPRVSSCLSQNMCRFIFIKGRKLTTMDHTQAFTCLASNLHCWVLSLIKREVLTPFVKLAEDFSFHLCVLVTENFQALLFLETPFEDPLEHYSRLMQVLFYRIRWVKSKNESNIFFSALRGWNKRDRKNRWGIFWVSGDLEQALVLSSCIKWSEMSEKALGCKWNLAGKQLLLKRTIYACCVGNWFHLTKP